MCLLASAMPCSYLSVDEENPISDTTAFPPGVRFRPSDEELITFYLQRKVKCLPLPPNVINDIEFYRYNPWDLPRRALFGEDECYFFTPRDRKYPKGGRPNRTTESGYWKATGTDKPIFNSRGSTKIGVKKTLVFYKGKPPSRLKMDWIMTEYRLPDASRPLSSKGSMRLDEWVICRIRQKGNMSKNAVEEYTHLNHSTELPECVPKINNVNTCKDSIANHFLSSEHLLVASLLINGDGKLNYHDFYENIITGTLNKAANEQRDMMTCQVGDNVRASFGTNYSYWKNLCERSMLGSSCTI